ncbi:MAG TPA: hypothetical protein VEX38_04480, partial [Fimbriimonadaceae bacterium]|nr:hypothetical protein [Fimbriimonadaceae bacterium]
TSLDLVGINMHKRMVEENKPGTTMRTGASYSTWWNGGLRTTAYFHNIVGILTETIGSPTPMRIPLVPGRLVPQGNLPFPIEPQEWKFRQSVEYSHTANMAILDLAFRYREKFLFNVWRMGRNSIERASRDNWTQYPSRVEGTARNARLEDFKKPELRDARAYVMPSNQPDFPTAVKFANALVENGVEVHFAFEDLNLGGKKYPPGSLVVRCDQAFRPHILDMFEPQDHPNDIPAPGAPPTPPYDNAGYTLAYQMGVQFDRILEALPDQLPISPAPNVFPAPVAELLLPRQSANWTFSPIQNDSFRFAAELLKAKIPVDRLPDGRFLVGEGAAGQRVRSAAKSLGIQFNHEPRPPKGQRLKEPRVGLWDRYGGSMESGWTRWIFEQFEIPFKVIFAPELDGGKLTEKYDVLIFVDGAIPGRTTANTQSEEGEPRPAQERDMPAGIPEEFRSMWGRVTAEKTVPELRKFLEAGGTVITIGSSTSLAYHLDLPVTNALVGTDGKSLPRAQYYIPGSVLRAKVAKDL